MAQRHVQGFKGALQQQREIANLIKAEEETASQKRMANLWEIEKRRQDEERQKGRQQAQQQVILVIAFIIGVLFVLLMLGAFAALVFFR
jgi:Flp pilus assembly protein TadB